MKGEFDEKSTSRASASVTMGEAEIGTKKVLVKKKTTTVNKSNQKEKKMKVYSLPGQKHEPPDERNPLRVFYETLREQRPCSEMAELWLMEHGLLSAEDAEEAFEKKQGHPKLATPVKAPKPELHGAKELVEAKAGGAANDSKIKVVSKAKKKLDKGVSQTIKETEQQC